MNEQLLKSFMVVSGLPPDEISAKCSAILLPNKSILEFFIYKNRFPSYEEADFISDIGLFNYLAICERGVITV